MRSLLLPRYSLALAVSALPLLADFTYDQTSQVTGGSLVKLLKMASVFSKESRKVTQPTLQTVSLKGNRMITKTEEMATIIDLDAQTFTTVDYAKKTYAVSTFDQLRQQLAQIGEKTPATQANGVQPSFQVKLKDTGQTKEINGSTTHQMLVSMIASGTDRQSGVSGAMNILSDMWIAPDVPGYAEARTFMSRMAQSLNWVPGQNPLLNRADVASAMSEFYKNSSNLEGMPMMTTIRVGATVDDPNGTLKQAAAQQPQPPPAAESAPTSLSGVFGGALAKRLGQSRHPKQDEASSPDDGSLLVMTNQVNRYNADPVDPTLFDIPAGFRKIDQKPIRPNPERQ